MEIQTIENEYIKFWKKDGILFSEYKAPFQMNLENSKEIYALREQISNGESQYFCYDIGNLKSMSKESRLYGEKNGQNLLAASAIVINSHVTKLIYALFLKLYKVKIPTKAFASRQEAEKWLHTMKNENA